MSCIFCDYIGTEKIVLENELAAAFYDNFPVNKGHTLIVPKRHFANFFEATPEEVLAINSLLHEVKKMHEEINHPDGYNIGINVNEAGGQTIFHLHVHLIPRYLGDVENPRGGIRKFKTPLVEYDG